MQKFALIAATASARLMTNEEFLADLAEFDELEEQLNQLKFTVKKEDAKKIADQGTDFQNNMNSYDVDDAVKTDAQKHMAALQQSKEFQAFAKFMKENAEKDDAEL